jgi:hypothetical protein
VLKVANKDESVQCIQRALANEDGPVRDVVLLNAGAALYCAGVASNLADGVKRAREAVASGRADGQAEPVRRAVTQQACWAGRNRRRDERHPASASSRSSAKKLAAARATRSLASLRATKPRQRRRDVRAFEAGRCVRQGDAGRAGGHRRGQEGQPQQGRAARALRAGGDRRQLPATAARPA